MQVELIRVNTEDGLVLPGVLALPKKPGTDLPVDACILVHGRGGSFYSSGLPDDVGGALLEKGCAVFRINTRGGGGEVVFARTEGGRLPVGAACEVVDHCRYDLDAWVGLAVERGYERIALWGHSLGAVKSIYYQARIKDVRVKCIVAGSPPWLSHAHFLTQPEGKEIEETCERAKALVDDGRGDEILEVAGPLRGTLSSATQYLEKYGPDDNYNILKYLPQVGCPTLVTTGTEEARTMAAFRGLHERLEALSRQQPNLSAVRIQGADHSYTGVRQEMFQAAWEWLLSL